MDEITDQITVADHGERITITLTGAAVANLRRAAEVLNSLPWCDHDNTAETVLRGFACFPLEYWGESAPHYEGLCLSEQLDNLVAAIDTDAEDEDEDEARRAELRAALYAAFDVKGLAELAATHRK